MDSENGTNLLNQEITGHWKSKYKLSHCSQTFIKVSVNNDGDNLETHLKNVNDIKVSIH